MKIGNELDCLATELLTSLGIKNPTNNQTLLIETILSQHPAYKKITFSKQLSPREITCLYLAAKGKTTQQTAHILNISPTTVETHRNEIKKKLKCLNMAQAVYEGMQFGYLYSHLQIQQDLDLINKQLLGSKKEFSRN